LSKSVAVAGWNPLMTHFRIAAPVDGVPIGDALHGKCAGGGVIHSSLVRTMSSGQEESRDLRRSRVQETRAVSLQRGDARRRSRRCTGHNPVDARRWIVVRRRLIVVRQRRASTCSSETTALERVDRMLSQIQ
jgi:hypothetical protein